MLQRTTVAGDLSSNQHSVDGQGMCNARKFAANHQECNYSGENNDGEGGEKPPIVDKLTISLEQRSKAFNGDGNCQNGDKHARSKEED